MSTRSPEAPVGFDVFELRPEIVRGISAAGFARPWPIQVRAIPAVLVGRDVLGLAQTGTGKTAAFALPILERILARRRPGPRALVVAPTRELAQQIDAEVRLLAKFTPVHTATVFGGVPASRQIEALRRRPDILVACPGRLLDLMGQRVVDLSWVETLVLDEADHMFDMGFLPDVQRILAALPAKRQNLLFSATMPREVRHLADRLLSDPLVIELQPARPPSAIDHALYPVDEKRKLALLQHLIAAQGFDSAIVFTRTKHRAKKIGKQLAQAGLKAVALQGNMTQAQRDKAMNGFRNGLFDILVATDIASRGIDVAQVGHVVNFDVPNTPEAYTHRIGRTGRAERSGKAYTFVTGEDYDMVRQIERLIGSSIPRLVVEGFGGAPAPASEKPQVRPERSDRNGFAKRGAPRHAFNPDRSDRRRGRTTSRGR